LSYNKKWITPEYDPELANRISTKFNISPLVAKVLAGRGITDDTEINNFLYTDISQFADPFMLPDMKIAKKRIMRAIECKEKIAVYGDYDVDGITATYILFDYLRSLNANVVYYIPNRSDEGYGLNNSAIDILSKEGVTLIITVDVGITATTETDFAKSKNIDIVITDHHTPSDILPDAIAVINPKLQDHCYPNKDLAGVGVAFKLIYALSGCDKTVIDKYCEFVCIGTISDMVPLTGENRFIASYGLNKLSHTENIGLNSLIEIAGIEKTNISSSNISFAIAPRLNAAGRLGSAEISVKLFLSENHNEAKTIAAHLDEGNKIRQITEQQILNDALEIIDKYKMSEDKVIVVSGNGWHHGVIGIVASKISEKYYRPTMVISVDEDGTAKASGRSVPGFNLYDALSNVSQYLDKFGGHELAAGFSLHEENISLFRKSINKYAETIFSNDMLTPKLKIDAEISVDEITLKNAKELSVLEPYGIGNRTPVFSLKNLTVHSVKIHKDGKHAFLSFKKAGGLFSSPAFNMADKMAAVSSGDMLNIAGTININSFKGTDNVQYIIKDTKVSPQSDFSIENLRCVFIVIKDYLNKSKNRFSLSDLSKDIKNHFNCHFGNIRLKKAIEVLSQVSIIEASLDDEYATVWHGENFNKKTDITESHIYKEYNTHI